MLMTPCEKRGFGEGMVLEVIEGSGFLKSGESVTLSVDESDSVPIVINSDGMCSYVSVDNLRKPVGQSNNKQTSSGGDNDYWVAEIKNPKRLEPYKAECEDLIEHFQMTFQEGEAFKALWRKGQLRIGNGKPGDTLIRNSEKVEHFGKRMVAMENEEG
jgi:hypothetical protein